MLDDHVYDGFHINGIIDLTDKGIGNPERDSNLGPSKATII